MVWVWQRPKKMSLKKKSPSSHLLCSRFDGVARNLGHFTGHVLGPSGWHTGRPGVGCTPNSVTWEITITHTYPLYTTIWGFFGGFPIRGYIGSGTSNYPLTPNQFILGKGQFPLYSWIVTLILEGNSESTFGGVFSFERHM